MPGDIGPAFGRQTAMFMTDVTVEGPSDVLAPGRPEVSVQVWSSAGSATVELQASNHPKAFSEPGEAAWDTVATFTLTGEDQAALRDVIPFVALRLVVTNLDIGPVSGALGA